MELGSQTSGSGSPAYLLHGFTQSRECWGPITASLSAAHTVTAFDLPGHGDSHGCMAGLEEGADLLSKAANPGLWIGYSMGGRFALHVALEYPELVESLVLVGTHPGIESAAERHNRLEADVQRACTIIVDGVEAFLDSWLDLPLFADLKVADRDLKFRSRNSPEGLASSLLFASTGAQADLWPRLHELEMPVLLVVGERDEKFTEIAKTCADEIGTNARLAVVAEAGHSVHRERPEAFLAAVSKFLPV